jgi:hypothetical protein
MSLNMETPPRWVEALLERLLSERDRETVAGDLREEYGETVYPGLGAAGAKVWYVRQVLSMLRRSLSEGGPMKKTLLPLSMFTFACACWLGVMEMVLRHPGYGLRVGVAALIALISMATIVGRLAHLEGRSEEWRWAGAILLIGIGGEAFLRNARATHFEGFVLLISLALVLQGVLMLSRPVQGGAEHVV